MREVTQADIDATVRRLRKICLKHGIPMWNPDEPPEQETDDQNPTAPDQSDR